MTAPRNRTDAKETLENREGARALRVASCAIGHLATLPLILRLRSPSRLPCSDVPSPACPEKSALWPKVEPSNVATRPNVAPFELCRAAERRLAEPCPVAECRPEELHLIAEGHPCEIGLIGEQCSFELRPSAERCPGEPRQNVERCPRRSSPYRRTWRRRSVPHRRTSRRRSSPHHRIRSPQTRSPVLFGARKSTPANVTLNSLFFRIPPPRVPPLADLLVRFTPGFGRARSKKNS